MSVELQDNIIARFIARADAFALQTNDGKWHPARVSSDPKSDLFPWNRDVLQAHLDGEITAGHYVLSTDSTVKLITFDIDLKADGFYPINFEEDGSPGEYETGFPREVWHNRAHPARPWLKNQLRTLGGLIAARAYNELGVPVAMSYSGNKGIHVYAFTDEIPAEDARIGANLVMESLGFMSLTRGSFEWSDTRTELAETLSNMSVEVFPKQNEVDTGSFGNLVAMPLGVNQKWDDPKFFVDMREPMSELAPCDPLWALTTNDPWAV